jgi:hypothetical protein
MVGGGLALAGVAGTIGQAGAATYAPSNYTGGSGTWGALTFDGSTFPPNADGSYGPITVHRHYDSGVSPAPFEPTAADSFGNRYWTGSFTAGPFTFSQTGLSQCPFSNDSCQYYVTVSGGQSQFNDLILAAGQEPTVPDGQPSYFQQFRASNVTFTPSSTTTSTTNATTTSTTTPASSDVSVEYHPGTGSAGTITLDASGFDTHGATGATYHWTFDRVSSSDPTQTFDCGTSALCTKPFSWPPDASYDVTLTVKDSTGATIGSTSRRLAPPSSGSTPTTTTPAPGGGSGGGTTPTTAPPNLSGGNNTEVPSVVVFARAPGAPAALTADPGSVVWLWRPDDYTPEAKKAANPANDGQLKGKTTIEIATSKQGVDDSNAGPWLAGLGLFGLVGFGGMVKRRRKLRFDP